MTMTFDDLVSRMRGIEHTVPEKGRILYDTVRENRFERCLELGFACGVGSAYIALALEHAGRGHLVSVDTQEALVRKPRADMHLESLGLSGQVSLIYDELGYLWYLKEALRQKKTFDFVFIDGSHAWEIDGFAFLLVERMLEPGGLVIFDDLDWTIATSPTMKSLPFPERKRQNAGVRDIFELLVKTTDGLAFWEDDGWGYCRKA